MSIKGKFDHDLDVEKQSKNADNNCGTEVSINKYEENNNNLDVDVFELAKKDTLFEDFRTLGWYQVELIYILFLLF